MRIRICSLASMGSGAFLGAGVFWEVTIIKFTGIWLAGLSAALQACTLGWPGERTGTSNARRRQAGFIQLRHRGRSWRKAGAVDRWSVPHCPDLPAVLH